MEAQILVRIVPKRAAILGQDDQPIAGQRMLRRWSRRGVFRAKRNGLSRRPKRGVDRLDVIPAMLNWSSQSGQRVFAASAQHSNCVHRFRATINSFIEISPRGLDFSTAININAGTV
jgi:hypothetical protein